MDSWSVSLVLAAAAVELELLVGMVCSSFKEFRGRRPAGYDFFSETGLSLKEN